MFSKDRVLEILSQGYQEELAFIDNLTPEQRAEKGNPEVWSAKDVLAHIAEWKFRLVDRLESGAPRGDQSDEAVDHTNATIYEQHHNKLWDEVRALLDEAYRRSADYVRTASEHALTTPRDDSDTRAPWQALLGNNVSHAMIHLCEWYLTHGQSDRAVALQERITEKMLTLDDPESQGVAVYNLACIYARTSRSEAAIRRLGEALRLNPDLTEWSKEDPDLLPLHEEASYQALYS